MLKLGAEVEEFAASTAQNRTVWMLGTSRSWRLESWTTSGAAWRHLLQPDLGRKCCQLLAEVLQWLRHSDSSGTWCLQLVMGAHISHQLAHQ